MIVVFGSNILDMFFDIADLPAKDMAVFLQNHVEAPGGKGANQAVACAKAGSEVHFFGALGKGGHGRYLLENLIAKGVDTTGVEFFDMPSGLAAIFVDKEDGTHKIVVSKGANLFAKQDTIPDSMLNEDTVVLLQAELPMYQTEKLIERAKKAGAKTVLNLDPITDVSEDALLNLDIIILNEHDADGLGKQYGMGTNDKMDFSQKLAERFNITVIITLGSKGSVCVDKKTQYKIPPLKIKSIDAVGAGDAYIAFLSTGLEQGKTLLESLRQASIAGSLACTRFGAQEALPTASEIEAYLGEMKIEVKHMDTNTSEIV